MFTGAFQIVAAESKPGHAYFYYTISRSDFMTSRIPFFEYDKSRQATFLSNGLITHCLIQPIV